MRKLKLIWDFRGQDSLIIAEHHELHLKEFIASKKLHINITGVEHVSEIHSIAYLVVNENEMKPIRDTLRPHRGQVFKSS